MPVPAYCDGSPAGSLQELLAYPRRTVIWDVLGNVDAAELDKVTVQWVLA
jgi:hypothetical protein